MGQPKGKAKVKAAAKEKAKASALLARRLSPQGPNNPNAPRQRQASPGLEPQRQAGRAQSVGSHAAPPWSVPGNWLVPVRRLQFCIVAGRKVPRVALDFGDCGCTVDWTDSLLLCIIKHGIIKANIRIGYLPTNWLVVSNIFYFSIYREFHHPNWRTHIFSEG